MFLEEYRFTISAYSGKASAKEIETLGVFREGIVGTTVALGAWLALRIFLSRFTKNLRLLGGRWG